MNREPPPGPAESKTLSMRGRPAHENRESPEVPVDSQPTGRSGKASGRKPDMHATGQSDIGVVPMRASNKAGPRPAAEMKEGRPMTKENPEKPAATRTQSRGEAMSGLDRIRKAARGDKTLRLNNLMHHVTVDLLRESYHALKHDAAAGVDEVTWHQYGEGLEERLADLRERAQSGRYRPKPSKRTYISKAEGRQRPIGIAAMRNKVLQRGGRPGPGRAVVRGYFNYHAVPDNIRVMNVFRGLASRFWHRALRRRSQKGKYLRWERMG